MRAVLPGGSAACVRLVFYQGTRGPRFTISAAAGNGRARGGRAVRGGAGFRPHRGATKRRVPWLQRAGPPGLVAGISRTIPPYRAAAPTHAVQDIFLRPRPRRDGPFKPSNSCQLDRALLYSNKSGSF